MVDLRVDLDAVRELGSSLTAKMTESLRMLADSSSAVADAFTDIDTDLAQAIEGEDAPVSSGGPV